MKNPAILILNLMISEQSILSMPVKVYDFYKPSQNVAAYTYIAYKEENMFMKA